MRVKYSSVTTHGTLWLHNDDDDVYAVILIYIKSVHGIMPYIFNARMQIDLHNYARAQP